MNSAGFFLIGLIVGALFIVFTVSQGVFAGTRPLNAYNFANKECDPMAVKNYGMLNDPNLYVVMCKTLDGGVEVKVFNNSEVGNK